MSYYSNDTRPARNLNQPARNMQVPRFGLDGALEKIYSKQGHVVVVAPFLRNHARLQEGREMIARVFAREKMSIACRANYRVLLAFLEGALEPILEDGMSTIAFSEDTGEPVAFCLILSLAGVQGEGEHAEEAVPAALGPIFEFTGAMQEAFFQRLAQGITHPRFRFFDPPNPKRILDAYRKGQVAHALMAGRDVRDEYRGVTRGAVAAACKRAWKAGKRYVVAEATSPESASLLLRHLGGQIVLTASYQDAGAPLNTIPVGTPASDWLPDVEKNAKGHPLYTYCREMLVDLDSLAKKEHWT